MGVDRETFYDDTRVCILPMGFCYHGKGKSGDLSPVPRCAETWRQPLLNLMPNIQLTLVIGQYAHWLKKNAWFEKEVVLIVTNRVEAALR